MGGLRRAAAIAVASLFVAAPSARAQEEMKLSIEETIRVAIERSPEFVILRQDLSRAAARVEFEEGFFHPNLLADVRGTYLDDPGGTSSFEELRKNLLSQLGLGGTLITGLRYGIGIELLLEQVDSEFTAFERGQTLRFRLEATQPLLRGGWLGPNRALIVIRSIEEKATRARSYARAAELLARVEGIYWRLVLAREELAVQKDALLLSDRQVEDSRARLKLGAVASIQVLEAEAAVSRRQAAIEAANANLASAEAELLRIIVPPEKRQVELAVIPTDQPTIEELTTSAAEDLEAAYRERYELIAAQSDVQAADEALSLARNALLPALDLYVNASITGFSGRPDPDMPVPADSDLIGEFDDVFANTKHPAAYVGLRLELPLTNDRAEAGEQIASTEHQRRRAREEELKNRIYSEVLAARKTLMADLRRVDSAKILVERTEALLAGQRQSFKAGAAVSFDVVRATVDVTRARIELLRAEISSRISYSRLLLAKGQYLAAHHIDLQLEPKPQ